ncbi:MAG: hypothetical protein O3A18_10880 [Planctomycetota bacterium]|jgi:hypothetical protein|nr:hypothetical protein [Planctomycetota bacterium]
MSVLRPRPPEEPLGYELTDAAAVADLAPRLEAVRDTILSDPAAVDLAARTLADYDTARPASDLFAILAAAREIRDRVDRLVVVAGGTIGPATRLLTASCCHPFHDQLGRGERGGRPRLSWLDGRSDNDTIQGLRDLVAGPASSPSDDLLDRWALMPIDCPADDSRQEAIVGLLLEPLAESVAGDPRRLAERIVPVTVAGGALAQRMRPFACRWSFPADPEVHTLTAAFSAATLFPAAAAGIDVVRFLKGGAAMLQRFREAPLHANPPLLDAAMALTERYRRQRWERRFAGPQGGSGWLSELADWLAGPRRPGPLAAAVVTRVVAGEPRRDRLELPPPAEDDLAAVASVIHLPRIDEHAVGQLLQALILSAAVERLLEQPV